MFEIIMLFAFLFTASSQMLPRKHHSNKLTAGETNLGKKKQSKALQQSVKKLERNRGKVKRRNRDCAYAA